MSDFDFDAEDEFYDRARYDDEYAAGYVFPGTCPACGWNLDYCEGHDETSDWEGYVILAAHGADHHEYCHGQAECVMGDWEPEPW